MAVLYKTQGLVIRKTDSGEADRIFTVLSKDYGKIKIKGRAIRKITSKLRGGIDTFNLSGIEFIQGKNQKILTDAVVLEKFAGTKRDLAKIKISQMIGQSLDSLLVAEEKDEKVWNLTNKVYEKLNQYELSSSHYLLLYYYFLWNLFSILGYKPELFYCSVCQQKLNPDILCFSSNEGGAVCELCVSKIVGTRKINADLVKILRLILKKDWEILPKLKFQPFSQRLLQETTDHYYRHLLSIHLSEEHLKERGKTV